jgi:hypothetical protein
LDFENVHRTFTRHNVGTWIRARQNEQERVDLVTAVRWEAARRRDDPILGSHGIHLEHLAQIEDLEAANAALVAQLNNNGNNNGNGGNNGNNNAGPAQDKVRPKANINMRPNMIFRLI